MKSNPFHGRYLFHFHTQLTDGKLSIEDYFEYAATWELDSLIFLEHIRRQPGYDVQAFLVQIRDAERRNGVRAWIGFETKLLPDGSIDISDENLRTADVVGIAEHGFPEDLRLLHSAFNRAVDVLATSFPGQTFVWVHPGLWFKKRKLESHTDDLFLDMLAHAHDAEVFIERNQRYELLDERLPISSELVVYGADAHDRSDLENWRSTQWNPALRVTVSKPGS
jgi:putative hydrolase